MRAEFIAGVLANDPDAKIAALGDFNEFEFVSPLEILEGARLANLTETLPEDERYSFIFQGNSQSLDHILASDALADGAQFDAVHVNAEFADTPSRASDHDPLLASFLIEGEDEFLIASPDRPDQLIGTDADEIFVTGGGVLNRLTLGGGADEIRFADTLNDGVATRVLVSDFMTGEDSVDFTADDVSFSRQAGPNLYVSFDSGDIAIFAGVNGLDQLFAGPDDLLA